jgi:F0F1-type ATP synthase assembly protein I
MTLDNYTPKQAFIAGILLGALITWFLLEHGVLR